MIDQTITKTERPVILCFVAYYLPGFRAGGPLRTISNLVDRLGNEFEIRIVTSDRDVGDTSPYLNVQIDTWNQVGKAKVFYASARRLSLLSVVRLLRETPHDVLYLNSFWTPKFTCFPLLARRLGLAPKIPCVIAPRGEFSPGALALKAGKKRLYLAATRAVGLYAGLRWQASSEHERADILRTLPWVHPDAIHVAIDLTPMSSSEATLPPLRLRATEDPLNVCFLSRISPMKNLDFALHVLTKVRSKVVFTIYGPKEDIAYWQVCEALVAALPSNIRVVDGGEVHPSNVKARLAEQDLFFLPTRGENYGHVIHEALSAGLPVLISDHTPWQDLEERGVGWALALEDENEFTKQIHHVSAWSAEKYQQTRSTARAYAVEKSTDKDVLESNRLLFSGLTKQS
jgi:glycosyltransferase involved in cell wall biosynthesis